MQTRDALTWLYSLAQGYQFPMLREGRVGSELASLVEAFSA